MIKENLEKILAAKNQIKQSLINKKAITEDTAFADYAAGIDQIKLFEPVLVSNWTAQTSITSTNTYLNANAIPPLDIPNNITRIGSSVFMGMPVGKITGYGITDIGNDAFFGCKVLAEINFPNATKIGSNAFSSCIKLSAIDLPNCTEIGRGAFSGCTLLDFVSVPKLEKVSGYTFIATSVQKLILPAMESVASFGFAGTYDLSVAVLPVCNFLNTYAFASCYSLSSLYLLSNAVAKLSSTTALMGTMLSSSKNNTYGSIYVPMSLLATYKTSTNWVAYSSRFVGMNDEEIQNLEV